MTVLQNNYGQLSARPAAAGELLAGEGAYDVLSRSAGSPSPQINVITVDTAANSTAYTYTFEGITVSYTSDASATKPEIADGLAAAHNAALNADGTTIMTQAIAVSDGVDAVTITARELGVNYTVAESDANLSLATTAADPGSLLAFGIGVDEGSDYQSAELHASGGPFLGVVKRFQRQELYSSEAISFSYGRPMDIVAQGLVWVLLDAGQSPSPGDDVYCRHTASGSEVQGAFRTDADTADADQITNASWVGAAATDIDGNNVALLRLK